MTILETVKRVPTTQTDGPGTGSSKSEQRFFTVSGCLLDELES